MCCLRVVSMCDRACGWNAVALTYFLARQVYDIMRRTQLVMTVDAVEYVHKLLTRAD